MKAFVLVPSFGIMGVVGVAYAYALGFSLVALAAGDWGAVLIIATPIIATLIGALAGNLLFRLMRVRHQH
jgi:hypothetical protein